MTIVEFAADHSLQVYNSKEEEYGYFQTENITGYVTRVYNPHTFQYYIIISFAGTDELQDWITNLTFSQNKLGLHRGWSEAYKSIKKQVDRLIKNYPKDMPIIATGHSMGGCLAGIFALFYSRKRPVHLITFGQPKFCNRQRITELESSIKAYIRIVNPLDLFTKLPFGYAHGGEVEKLFWLGNPHSAIAYSILASSF